MARTPVPLVFLCVDLQKKDDMWRKMERHLAIRNLIQSPTFGQLAQYQQDALQEQKGKSQTQAAIAAQQAYRHLFYPSRARAEGSSLDLAHASIPQALSFFVGRYFGSSYSIELEGWALKHSLQPDGSSHRLLDDDHPADTQQAVIPSEAAWQQFAQALDALRVWAWDTEYDELDIMDGTQWSLDIRWDGKSISTHGSNAFSQQFDGLKKALSTLLGGLNVDGTETPEEEDTGSSGNDGGVLPRQSLPIPSMPKAPLRKL